MHDTARKRRVEGQCFAGDGQLDVPQRKIKRTLNQLGDIADGRRIPLGNPLPLEIPLAN
jgi:hypothetical protein